MNGTGHIEGAPDFETGETRWRNADDFDRPAIERQLPAEHRGSRAELALPERAGVAVCC